MLSVSCFELGGGGGKEPQIPPRFNMLSGKFFPPSSSQDKYSTACEETFPIPPESNSSEVTFQ